MPGVIVQHPTLRNSYLVYEIPPTTPQGSSKPIRLNFNHSGQAVLGEDMWATVQMHRTMGFHDADLVAVGSTPSPEDLGRNPPTQTQGFIVSGGAERNFNDDEWKAYLRSRRDDKRARLRAAAAHRREQALLNRDRGGRP